MTIHYQCEECGAGLKIKDRLSGTEGACPKCKATFTVPDLPCPGEAGPDGQTASDESGAIDEQHGRRAAGRRQAAVLATEHATDGHSETEPALAGCPAESDDDDSEDATASKARAAMVAYDLMKRSAEEANKSAKPQKPYWQEQEESKQEPGVDYGELALFVALRVVPGIAAVVVGFFLVYWMAWSAYGPKRNLPELARVSGIVTFDNEPLAGARIMFHPVKEATSTDKVSSSIGTTDAAGRYELNYVHDVRGAVLGRHLVEIRAPDEHGGERLPLRYHNLGSSDGLTAEVEPKKNNQINFDLKSAP